MTTKANNNPTTSVIMTVFNQEKRLLKAAIDSILNQQESDLELLIVDDGSTEIDCLEILDVYKKNDSRVKIIRNNKNEGITHSLNKAILLTKGVYIARMDSDDISLPDRFAKQLSYLKKYNLDLIGSNCFFIDINDNMIGGKNVTAPKSFQRKLMYGNFFTHSTFFGTRKIFLEMYNKKFTRSQDYEFLLRVASKKYKLGYLQDQVLKYRFSAKSISSKKAKSQEWFAIKARWYAIRYYNYNPFYLLYLLRALLIFLVPYKMKVFIINNIIQ